MVCSLCGYELKRDDEACTVCGGGTGSALPTGLKRTQSTSHAEHTALQLACVDVAELLAQAGITDNSNKQRGTASSNIYMNTMEQRYCTQPRLQVAAHSSTLTRLSDPLTGYDTQAALSPAARRRRAQQAARDVITSAAAAEHRSSAQSRPPLNSTVTDRPVQGGGHPRKHSAPRVMRFGSAIDALSSNKQTQQQQRSRSQLRSRGQGSSSTSGTLRSSAEHLRLARTASSVLQPTARKRVRQRSQLAADRSKRGRSALSSSVAVWVARDDRGAPRREAALSRRAAAAGLKARTDGGSFVHAANSSSTFLTELEAAAETAADDASSVLHTAVQADTEPQSAAAAQLTALLSKQHRQRNSAHKQQQQQHQFRNGLTLQQLKLRDKQRPPQLSVTAAPYSSSNVEHTRAHYLRKAQTATAPVDALCGKLCSQPSTATAHTSSSTTYSSESLWEGAKRAALSSRGGNDITAFRGLVPPDTAAAEAAQQLLPVLSWRQQQQQQQRRSLHSRGGDAPPSSAPSPGPLRQPVMLRSRTSPALGTSSISNSSSYNSSSALRQQVAAAQRGQLTAAVAAAATAPLVYVGKPAKFAVRLQQSQLAPSCGSSVRSGPVLRPQGFMTRSMAYSSSAAWGR
eukprot:13445-Heterococcus_DN1.PRE.1